MILKVIGWVLLGLLAVVLLLLMVPVKVRGAYRDGKAEVTVRYGPVKLQILPPKGKKESEEPKPAKPQKARPKKEKPKKPRAKINTEQILYALEKLPPILGRALKRTGRSIHIRPLQLYILAAGPDPAAVGILYGRLEAALAAGFPVLERVLRIQDADVRLYVDFTARQMDFILDAGVSLRPWDLVWMALRAGGSLIKWYIGFRRLASPPPESAAEPADKTDAAADAA